MFGYSAYWLLSPNLRTTTTSLLIVSGLWPYPHVHRLLSLDVLPGGPGGSRCGSTLCTKTRRHSGCELPSERARHVRYQQSIFPLTNRPGHFLALQTTAPPTILVRLLLHLYMKGNTCRCNETGGEVPRFGCENVDDMLSDGTRLGCVTLASFSVRTKGEDNACRHVLMLPGGARYRTAMGLDGV